VKPGREAGLPAGEGSIDAPADARTRLGQQPHGSSAIAHAAACANVA